MERTVLLVIIISEEQKDLKNSTGVTAKKNIHASDTLVVESTQINRINEAILSSKPLSEILIICEDQIIEQNNCGKMLECLYSCERHGAVVSLNMYSEGICQLTREQHEKTSKYLSSYKVVPYIESVPVMIKVEMFERFGLLDESMQSIMGALAEFSMRFNQYGWNTVRANCWSDGGILLKKVIGCDIDILKKKYPYIHKIEEMYYIHQQKAAEHFADKLILGKGQKPKLLFSLYEIRPSYNGTANYALDLLAAFWNSYHDKYEISILVGKAADEFHKLSKKYPQVYYYDTIGQHTFHLGYVVSHVFCAEHMDIINNCCLKYAVCMLDVICLRSHYMHKNDINMFDLFRDSMEYADLMLSISKFSHDDIVSFFHDEVQRARVKTGYIYLATNKKKSDTVECKMVSPFKNGDYFIVIGNVNKNKMIEPVLEVLKDIEANFVVIGTKTEGYYDKSKRIYGYVSGWLDSDSLNNMIMNSKCIIFPSVYEGFGLTLYDAAVYRKYIVVSDTQVNLELKKLLGEYGSYVLTYRRLEEIKTILSENTFEDSNINQTAEIRNWQDAAKDLDFWIESMQKEEIDILQLERRWKYLKRYGDEYNHLQTKKSSTRLKELFIGRCIACFPKTYQLYRKLVTAIDKEHYGSR